MTIINKPNLKQIGLTDYIAEFNNTELNRNENTYYKHLLRCNYLESNVLLCSAIYYPEQHLVVCGTNHSHALQYRNRLFEGIYPKIVSESDKSIGGFINLDGRFYDRLEAIKILSKSTQILRTADRKSVV